jgi:hypothetical protein
MPGGISLEKDRRTRLDELWQLTPEARARLREEVSAEIEKAKVFLEIASRR